MPEIPLSIGSKLELHVLLRALPNFRILPRTFTHLSAYVHVYCRVCIYMAETPRVLHFSAFIVVVAILDSIAKGISLFPYFSHGASHPYIPIHSIEWFLHLYNITI